MGEPRVVVAEKLSSQQVRAVTELVDGATEEDAVRPLSEHVMLHLRYGGEVPARHLLALVDDQLVGYAHLDPTDEVEGPSGELTIDPRYRGRGYGRALATRMLAEAPNGRLRLWAHGHHPAAAGLAASMGFRRIRSLWQMRRSLFAPLEPPVFPDDVRLRTFVVGQDDAAWVDLNARAFADHPEQGSWTLKDLRQRVREPWFDTDGFFLAERAGRLVGFHWTKVHGGDMGGGPEGQGGGKRGGRHGHEPIGEVYVVGVDPDERGYGLGKALTLVGLRYLRSRGPAQAMLYVEETNITAIRLYESLGFTHWDSDVMFASQNRAPRRGADPDVHSNDDGQRDRH
ncbi:MAG: mycothiol synthase [Streptosporangiales bacterium]|nr:mycothiol synthase [Streptosporangiales bacterium]